MQFHMGEDKQWEGTGVVVTVLSEARNYPPLLLLMPPNHRGFFAAPCRHKASSCSCLCSCCPCPEHSHHGVCTAGSLASFRLLPGRKTSLTTSEQHPPPQPFLFPSFACLSCLTFHHITCLYLFTYYQSPTLKCKLNEHRNVFFFTAAS